MKLKDWLRGLNELIATHPEALEMDVITARDDEGNGYFETYYHPSLVVYEDGDLLTDEEGDPEGESNAVLLN